METKRVNTTAELKADEEGSIRAIFSTFNVRDRGGDIVLPSAFKNGQAVPMVWSHDWDRPVGRGVVKVETDRAVFEGKFFLDTTWGLDAYRTVKAMGDLQEYSWGFQITDSEWGTEDGEQVRWIKGAELFEVSPVLVGEGLGTRTLAIKAAEAARAEDDQATANPPAADAAPEPEPEPLTVRAERLSTEVAALAAEIRSATNESLRADAERLTVSFRRLSMAKDEAARAIDRAMKSGDVSVQELARQVRTSLTRFGSI